MKHSPAPRLVARIGGWKMIQIPVVATVAGTVMTVILGNDVVEGLIVSFFIGVVTAVSHVHYWHRAKE